jgi:formamidopyrimidine-DNA glycosylase
MPELPEVETVRRGLLPHLEGQRLSKVVQRRPDLRFPLPERFAQRLTGARVLSLRRRAKYLLADLDTGDTLVVHLGMTGRFDIEAAGVPGRFHNQVEGADKHTHIVFETEAGDRVSFNDARRFGYMDLISTAGLAEHAWFKGLGPEPLEDAFDAKALAEAIAGRSQNIKATLLDQRLVAGLGNIYVSEALHRAKIAPERPAGGLKPVEARRLVEAIKAVLADAIAAGGSTLNDYRQVDGSLGYFQHAFRVYDREGEPCPDSKCTGVIRRTVQAGRSTFACARCQK